MADKIQQIREAFRIPEAITITTGTFISANRPRVAGTPESFDINTNIEQDAPLYTSALGTPVMADLEFLGGSYESDIEGVTTTFEGIKVDAVLITVNQPKKVISTEIQGRPGTVKEYIGMGDYEVEINLVLSGQNGVRPVDRIATMKRITDAPIALDVVSTYLQALGIDQIVILNAQYAQEEGSYSYQTVSISAVSDVLQELRLTNV